jgi:hypothetical protein
MDNSSIISINREVIENIMYELNAMQLLCDDKFIMNRLNKILNLLKPYTVEVNESSIKNIIYQKMQETRNIDADLHLQMYMLYRKLEEGKINEEQARNAYTSL